MSEPFDLTSPREGARDAVRADAEPTAEVRRVKGVVKWFDPRKDYGFIIVNGEPDIQRDAMMHVSVLRQAGHSRADEGANVECRIQRTERGWQVLSIDHIDPPKIATLVGLADEAYEPVMVKWFDTRKGFGFVQRPAEPDTDIFLHIVALREIGLAEVATGDILRAVVGPGKSDGLMVLALKATQQN